MESSKRRSYTEEQREAVLADVRTIGVIAAAKKHEVPQSCVSRWTTVAGVKREAAEEPAAASAQPPPVSAPPAREPARPTVIEAAPPPPIAPVGRPPRSRVARVYTPSQTPVAIEDAARDGVTVAAKKHGISRFSIYDWQRRVAKAAAAGEGPSPTSGSAPKDIEEQRDAEILDEWKTHPGLGPSQIVNQLRRKSSKVSVHTARRVVEDAGYRPPKVERQKHDRAFVAVRPNHLWHLDFVQRFIGRVSTFTLTLIDDCSRCAPRGRIEATFAVTPRERHDAVRLFANRVVLFA